MTPIVKASLARVLFTLQCLLAGSLRSEEDKAEEDQCDRQLQALEGRLSQACQNVSFAREEVREEICREEARNAIVSHPRTTLGCDE